MARFACVVMAALVGCGTQKTPPNVAYLKAPPDGEVAPLVMSTRASLGADARLLVYVGASWCEPCRRFHRAVEEGKLDSTFPGLRLLEFDLDRDHERLTRAGYVSRLIPLFARPGADGRASGLKMEGSIKGDGAVDEIVPRLTAILSGSI
jgi:hypothetical protein